MKRVLVLAVVALLAAVPAAASAKGDVRAHLVNRLDRDARAGETIRVVWRLYSVENGERRPFGASGLFVRLRSATGASATRAEGDGRRGRYTAHVKVPRGGIGGIRFGLEGIRMLPDGSEERAPHYFPLDNDPFARR
jgi:hypothetical protein